jgi:hypothetical protein
MLVVKHFEPLVALKSLLGTGSIRFFLGENGFVREFKIPGVLQMLDLIGRVSGRGRS